MEKSPLGLLKEQYDRIQKQQNYDESGCWSFLHDTVCPVIFDKESIFWGYIEPIMLHYDYQFKHPEFKKKFETYINKAKNLATEISAEITLDDVKCQKQETEGHLFHPFDSSCGLLVNAKLHPKIPRGKKLWESILKQAQDDKNYWNIFDKTTALKDQINCMGRFPRDLNFFFRAILEHFVDPKDQGNWRDPYFALEDVRSEMGEFLRSGVSARFNDYWQLFDGVFFTLANPNSRQVTTSNVEDKIKKYEREYYYCLDYEGKLLEERMGCYFSDIWERILQDLEWAEKEGRLKRLPRPQEEGKIKIKSPEILEYNGKTMQIHKGFRQKICIAALELNTHAIPFKELGVGGYLLDHKKNIQVWNRQIKTHFNISIDKPLISTSITKGEILLNSDIFSR